MSVAPLVPRYRAGKRPLLVSKGIEPLAHELKQGHKMSCLEATLDKLSEDKTRHAAFRISVKEGLEGVRIASAAPSLVTSRAPTPMLGTSASRTATPMAALADGAAKDASQDMSPFDVSIPSCLLAQVPACALVEPESEAPATPPKQRASYPEQVRKEVSAARDCDNAEKGREAAALSPVPLSEASTSRPSPGRDSCRAPSKDSAATAASESSAVHMPPAVVVVPQEEEERPQDAVRRLKEIVGAKSYIGILGGTEFQGAVDNQALVIALARELAAWPSLGRAALVTRGLAGVQETFANNCGEQGQARLWSLVPKGADSNYGCGTDLHAGKDDARCREVWTLLCDVYITVEGEREVAADARAALARGAGVLPLRRTGQASAGEFDFPQEALAKPACASEEHWSQLGSNDVYVGDTAVAAATIVAAMLEEQAAALKVPRPPAEPAPRRSLRGPPLSEGQVQKRHSRFMSQNSTEFPAILMGDEGEGFQTRVKSGSDPDSYHMPSSKTAKTSGDKNLANAFMLGMKYVPMQLRQSADRDVRKLRHSDEVMGAQFSPCGRWLVSGGEDCTMTLWDVGKQERLMEMRVTNPVMVVAFSPCGQYVAAADADSFITVWDTSTRETVESLAVEDEVLSLAVASKPEGLVAVGTTGRKVTLLTLPELEEVAELNHAGHVHSLSFSPDGATLAVAGGDDDGHGLFQRKAKADIREDTSAVIWRVAAQPQNIKRLGEVQFDDLVHAAAFSPSGKLLAVGGQLKSVAVLLADREFELALQLPCVAGVRCLAWSPESRFLAVGGEDLHVSVWDVITQSIVLQLPKATDWLRSVGFSSDGLWLASCGFACPDVHLYPVELHLEPERDPVDVMGKTNSRKSSIGASTGDKRISVTHITPRGRASSIVVPMEALQGMAFQIKIAEVDRAHLGVEQRVSGSESEHAHASLLLGVKLKSSVIQRCELRDCVKLAHRDEVMSLAFNADGSRVVTGGEDKQLVVWDVRSETRALEFTLAAHITQVAYSPCGPYVAAAYGGVKVSVWHTETQEHWTRVTDGSVLSIACCSLPTEMIAIGTNEKKVYLLSIPGLHKICKFCHDGHVEGLCFSPRGGLLAGSSGSQTESGMVDLLQSSDHTTKTVVWQTDPQGSKCSFLGSVACNGLVHATVFSPSGTLLAMAGNIGKIALLLVDRDFDTASTLPVVAGVRTLAWSPCSRLLASGGEDMMVSVWDIFQGRIVWQLPRSTDWISCVAFSPDSQWLGVCGFAGNSATLWPLEEVVAEEREVCDSKRSSVGGHSAGVISEAASDIDDDGEESGFKVSVHLSSKKSSLAPSSRNFTSEAELTPAWVVKFKHCQEDVSTHQPHQPEGASSFPITSVAGCDEAAFQLMVQHVITEREEHPSPPRTPQHTPSMVSGGETGSHEHGGMALSVSPPAMLRDPDEDPEDVEGG